MDESLFAHYDEHQAIFLNDLLVAPFVFLFIMMYAKSKLKYKKDFVYKKYFLWALFIRLLSSIAISFVYQYYYHGGDTIVYFAYAMKLKSSTTGHFGAFLDLLFNPNYSTFNAEYYFGKLSSYFFENESSRLMIRITTILSYVFFNSYLSITFIFSIFCFYGCWKLFRLFYSLYPHLHKEIALSCLFLPSICFWGSGLMKDSLCLGALGLLTYHLYVLFFKRTRILGRSIIIITCIFIISIIKTYIVLSFLPTLIFWIFLRARSRINHPFFQLSLTPILVIFGFFFSFTILVYLNKYGNNRYAMNELLRTAKDTQNWLYYSSQMQGGSGYSLGNIEYTPMGLLKVLPKAINVALFRPYLWEARKPILIPAALEGLISLFFTIRLLYKAGFVRFTKLIISNPEVQFCLVFSLIFAFCVGFTSYNFGALVRYKIPMMPFYYIALFILADKEKREEVTKESKRPTKTKPSNVILAPAL
jgi:hypothetical protein